MNNNYNELLEAYFASAEFSVLAESSKKNYRFFLTKFRGLGTEGLVVVPETGEGTRDLHRTDFNKAVTRKAWLDSIANLRSPKAQAVALRLLKVVFNWGYENDLCPQDILGRVKGPEVNPPNRQAFTKEEVSRFPEVIESAEFPARFKPYVKCAQLCFETGMRPNEAESLEWPAISENYVAIKSAKRREVGEVARLCRITEGVKRILDSIERKSNLVFCSVEGKPLNKDTRSKAMTKLCEALGIKRRHFYATRRGLATEMFKADYDISAIKAQLGHRSVKTTEIYLQPTLEDSANKFKGI